MFCKGRLCRPVPAGAGRTGCVLEGFAEAGAGDEAVGIVQVEPADVAVGPGAQFQDGDDAAEVVEPEVRGGI